jgi:integrase
MPRPPLPIGSWGRISTAIIKTDERGKPVTYRAKAKFRDHDGQLRDVTSYGKTPSASERALLTKLQDRSRNSRAGDLTAMDRIAKAIDLWVEKFRSLVADGHRSPTSLDTYLRAIKNHLLPAFGELRIGEATTPLIDRGITEIKTRAGAPTARTCRSIMSGVLGLCVRHGAISANPVRDVDRIEHNAKKLPRALTTDEIHAVRAHLETHEHAVNADLPDLVMFMLGTGVRIGESLAVLGNQLNLETGRVAITSTIVRVKGEGLIRKTTKSRAGQRELILPLWLLSILRKRAAAGQLRLDQPLFPDSDGGYRDPSNVRRSLRTSLSPVGSTARRDLGLALRAIRRGTSMTRRSVAEALSWPQTKIELIETGRVKVDEQMVGDLLRVYAVDPATVAPQIEAAVKPADADLLAWITSHVFRKTTATILDDDGQSARQIADQLGHARVSMTQDAYLGRKATDSRAAEALDRALEDPDLP